MGVELHQLRALLAVVEHGSFTDAGIALGLSQAAVSRAVAGLESRLGVRVLRRTTRSVGLTRPGVRVVEHARRVLDAVAALERVPAENPDDVRVGYAWSALGAHTVTVQRAWAREHPGTDLVFLQSSTATAGLAEGLVDVAVLRRPVHDARVATAVVGTELRYAALSTTDPLARCRGLVLADFAGRTIAVDPRTGTTDSELWPTGDGPTARREVHGIEDFLTCVAAGQAVGITSVATSRQHRRPGVVYRRVRDAPPLTVTLAWWRHEPPPAVPSLLALIRSAYAGDA